MMTDDYQDDERFGNEWRGFIRKRNDAIRAAWHEGADPDALAIQFDTNRDVILDVVSGANLRPDYTLGLHRQISEDNRKSEAAARKAERDADLLSRHPGRFERIGRTRRLWLLRLVEDGWTIKEPHED